MEVAGEAVSEYAHCEGERSERRVRMREQFHAGVGGIGVTSLLIKSTSRTVTSSGVVTRREYAAAMSCLRGA